MARVVVKALGSGRPHVRYLVGFDAQAIALYNSLVPSKVQDRLAQPTLGL